MNLTLIRGYRSIKDTKTIAENIIRFTYEDDSCSDERYHPMLCVLFTPSKQDIKLSGFLAQTEGFAEKNCDQYSSTGVSRLVMCAKNVDVEGVEKTLDKGELSTRRELGTGFLPIHFAITAPAIIRLFHERGMNLDTRVSLPSEKYHNAGAVADATPLFLAAARGLTPAVRCLLDLGANADMQTSGGLSGLMIAAFQGYDDITSAFIACKANLSCIITAEAPVLAARKELHCLHKGYYVHMRLSEYTGYTAMMLAASRGHMKIVLQLLEAGADITHITAKGESVLSIAIRKGNHLLFEILMRQKKVQQLLNTKVLLANDKCSRLIYLACRHGQLEMAKRILAAGGEIFLADEDYVPPLIGACRGGHVEMVKWLIDDCGQAVDHGWRIYTPLHVAVKSRACFEALLERGAAIDETSFKLAVNNDDPLVFALVKESRPAWDAVKMAIRLGLGAPKNLDFLLQGDTWEPSREVFEKFIHDYTNENDCAVFFGPIHNYFCLFTLLKDWVFVKGYPFNFEEKLGKGVPRYIRQFFIYCKNDFSMSQYAADVLSQREGAETRDALQVALTHYCESQLELEELAIPFLDKVIMPCLELRAQQDKPAPSTGPMQ